MSQSLFYWITYSYNVKKEFELQERKCLNPYFIGLPILIMVLFCFQGIGYRLSQSLFYWITYSYLLWHNPKYKNRNCLNPYFIGLPILIILARGSQERFEDSLNPYFIGLPILILSALFQD